MIYITNFKRLQKLIPDVLDMEPGTAKRLKAPGFMDLTVDCLVRERGEGYMVIAIAHRYEQNGDLMSDPDMELKIHFYAVEGGEGHAVEALTYQQDGLGIYQRVYPEPGKVAPRLQRELNQFLGMWLRNLLKQGHKEVVEGAAV